MLGLGFGLRVVGLRVRIRGLGGSSLWAFLQCQCFNGMAPTKHPHHSTHTTQPTRSTHPFEAGRCRRVAVNPRFGDLVTAHVILNGSPDRASRGLVARALNSPDVIDDIAFGEAHFGELGELVANELGLNAPENSKLKIWLKLKLKWKFKFKNRFIFQIEIY